MAFAFLFIGIILIISAARGTLSDLGILLKSELTGKNNFFYWLIAIGIVGAIGYNQKAQPFSRAFLTLIILAMILANKGVYANFMNALENVQTNSNAGQGTAAGNTLANTPAPQQSNSVSTSSQTNKTSNFANTIVKDAMKTNPFTGAIGSMFGF